MCFQGNVFEKNLHTNDTLLRLQYLKECQDLSEDCALVCPLNIKTLSTIIGIPIIKIIPSHGRFIFIMEITIPGKTVFILVALDMRPD